jgi:hypothetical protein
MTAGSTGDADGTDGVFSTRAHPDSRPCAAFTRERYLDAQRPQKRLRPPSRPASERGFFVHAVPLIKGEKSIACPRNPCHRRPSIFLGTPQSLTQCFVGRNESAPRLRC